jgi:hemerythrin-like metal-binding protein
MECGEMRMRRPTLNIIWSDGMSVGIPVIDEDHKQFLVLINELNRSIADRKAPDEIKNSLNLIIQDAERHFAQEEKLFVEWNYPDTSEHARIHAHVLNSLHEMQSKLIPYGQDSGWSNIGLEIKDLLINHILMSDMRYAEFFHKNRDTLSPSS